MAGMVTDVTSVEHFREVISRPDVSLVDFHAEWCGPCKLMESYITELSKTTPKIRFYKVDVDITPDVAQCVGGVHVMPTILIYQGGSKIESIAGATRKGLEALVGNLSK